jgi:hypothetical protein
MAQNFDLFGAPVRDPKQSAGRPAHEPTDENRNKIMLLFALGWKKESIAAALKLSMPTFRKHYFSEIKHAADALLRVEARHIERLWLKAEAGDMGAAKAIDRMIDRVKASQYADPEPKERVPRYGKKEAAQIAAQSAGADTEWGDDLQTRPDNLNS